MENPTSSSTQNYLREFLQDRHVACPACKRDLCGVEAPRCPGCNVELVLGLSSVEGYRWPWGVLVTLLTLDAAIGVLFATMVVNMGKWPTRYGLTPIFVMFMSSIPLVPLALFSQRRFYRQAVAFQWIWLGAGVMFTVVAFGSLFVLLLARR